MKHDQYNETSTTWSDRESESESKKKRKFSIEKNIPNFHPYHLSKSIVMKNKLNFRHGTSKKKRKIIKPTTATSVFLIKKNRVSIGLLNQKAIHESLEYWMIRVVFDWNIEHIDIFNWISIIWMKNWNISAQ